MRLADYVMSFVARQGVIGTLDAPVASRISALNVAFATSKTICGASRSCARMTSMDGSWYAMPFLRIG